MEVVVQVFMDSEVLIIHNQVKVKIGESSPIEIGVLELLNMFDDELDNWLDGRGIHGLGIMQDN